MMQTKLKLATLALALLSTLIYQPSTLHAQGTAFNSQRTLNPGTFPAFGSAAFFMIRSVPQFRITQ